VKKGKYCEVLEIGKMHKLGNALRALNPWSVFNPWTAQETRPKFDRSNESSRFNVYDDAAAATINPWAVFSPWDTQETQAKFDHSNESSRFHINAGAASVVNPWSVFNPWTAQKTQSTMEINTLTQNQIKAESYKALHCQGNLGPCRVLNLLRHNIAQLNNTE